jgi:NDP-sugar pyrophosphorylase family protein
MRDDAEGVWGGKLAAGPDGRLATFLGNTRDGSEPGPNLMFTGIHVFEPSFLDRVPAQGEQCIVRTAYRSLFEEGRGPGVHKLDGYWWEHSTPERYLAGMHSVLRGELALPHAEIPPIGVQASAKIAEGVEIVEPVFVGAQAHIETGAKIGPFAAIGAGARVAAGARVSHAIVWPDADCEGTLENSICSRPRSIS